MAKARIRLDRFEKRFDRAFGQKYSPQRLCRGNLTKQEGIKGAGKSKRAEERFHRASKSKNAKKRVKGADITYFLQKRLSRDFKLSPIL